jgi:alpha-beta hydrolase superfamily lysophospholipase
MNRDDFSFASSDGLQIAYFRWRAPGRGAGIVQIAHGMGEHSLRYAEVAAFLNDAGFHVYTNDHRGHGRSATGKDALGDFGAAGWNGLVADMVTVTKLARTREGALPVILLGHSMGSFAAQQYVLDNSASIAALVLSGSASTEKLAIDPSQPADLTNFNAAFEPARTPYDWLSRDNAAVDAYVADPLCGFGINQRAMQSMAAAAKRLTDPAEISRIRTDLPIYILAGEKDPINHNLEFIRPLAERYRAAGIADVTEKYYRDGRHEMFNETNRAEVLGDLLSWIRRAIAK